MKKPEYNPITGFPNQVYTSMLRKISQYERHCTHLKIGITGRAPEKRYKEHLLGSNTIEPDYWDRMVVLYRSSSINNVNRLEKRLVDYYKGRLACKVSQKCGGGSYHLPEEGDNYLYILLKY
jgi:hypothetical protein